MEQTVGHYATEVRKYWAESRDVRDFRDVMRVRLSQSAVGRYVTPKPIEVTVGLKSFGSDVVLRSHTTDIAVLGELIVSDGYVPVLSALRRPLRTIVDLGSNTGLTARWLRSRFPEATLVCVEPEPGNVEVLRQNVQGPGTHVFAACIGGTPRRVGLTTSNGEFAFTMVDLAPDAEGPAIDVITMDTVIEQTGLQDIDLLKCDIEGAERELFADCRRWIDRVDVLLVECHEGFTTPELVDVLADNGAAFEVLNRELNPAYRCEVATLRQRR